MSSAYCLDSANVLQEVIDGDVIMINLANDRYYTMNKSGQFIWALLQQGCGLPTIINLISEQCNITAQNVKNQVKDFVDNLLSEKLIVEQGIALNTSPAVPAGIISPMSGFLNPLLNRFCDMQSYYYTSNTTAL